MRQREVAIPKAVSLINVGTRLRNQTAYLRTHHLSHCTLGLSVPEEGHSSYSLLSRALGEAENSSYFQRIFKINYTWFKYQLFGVIIHPINIYST
jgi:hypothetical protein